MDIFWFWAFIVFGYCGFLALFVWGWGNWQRSLKAPVTKRIVDYSSKVGLGYDPEKLRAAKLATDWSLDGFVHICGACGEWCCDCDCGKEAS